MGIFEKRRMKRFMEFIGNYKEEDPTTHQGKDKTLIGTGQGVY
jgi:Rab GDP dissociation inhibitor